MSYQYRCNACSQVYEFMHECPADTRNLLARMRVLAEAIEDLQERVASLESLTTK